MSWPGRLYTPTRCRSSWSMYIHIPEGFCIYLYCLEIIFLSGLSSCKTPSINDSEEVATHTTDVSEEIEQGQLGDTTTILHHLVDSNTTITKIIRRTIYETRYNSRSDNDSTSQKSVQHSDSLTPDIIKTVLKGFAIACIGGGIVVSGFFVLAIVLVFKLIKRP